jgi:hypothetical protein
MTHDGAVGEQQHRFGIKCGLIVKWIPGSHTVFPPKRLRDGEFGVNPAVRRRFS